MQHNKMKTNTEPMRTAHEWVEWVTKVDSEKPVGIDDAHWAELTPKQKAVIAHRLLCISQYRDTFRGEVK